jgi:hypothetical protein
MDLLLLLEAQEDVLKSVYEKLSSFVSSRARDDINEDGGGSTSSKDESVKEIGECRCCYICCRISTDGNDKDDVNCSNKIKTVLIKSIVPEHFFEEEGALSAAEDSLSMWNYSLCNDCLGEVDRLVEMFAELERIRKDFKSIRDRLAQKVIRSATAIIIERKGLDDINNNELDKKTFLRKL